MPKPASASSRNRSHSVSSSPAVCYNWLVTVQAPPKRPSAKFDPPWIGRLLCEFAASDDRATRLVDGLTVTQLNWRPSPERWSIGQCLDHIRATNDAYLPSIANALAGQTPDPVSEIVVRNPSRWFIRNFIAPNPGGPKGRAPKVAKPAGEVSPGLLEEFLAGNVRVTELVRRAADYNVNRVRFKNPFVPLLRFTVGTGLEIMSKHESRHLLQAEEVKAHPAFPS